MEREDRRGKPLAWLVCAAVLCAPGVVWLVSVGSPIDYFTRSLPPGQPLYVLSKLAGLLAFCLFWLQCVFGLAHRAPVLKGFPAAGPGLHRRLGLATVGLALTHFILFVVAASLRAGEPAWNLLVPQFTHGYYSLHVSLGLIALWLLLAGAYAGWRTSRGHAAWKPVHMVWIVAFGLVFLHAFAIGSESRFGAMRYVLLFVATSAAAAVISRVYVAWRRRIRKATSEDGLTAERPPVGGP